jgi:dolichol kinase
VAETMTDADFIGLDTTFRRLTDIFTYPSAHWPLKALYKGEFEICTFLTWTLAATFLHIHCFRYGCLQVLPGCSLKGQGLDAHIKSQPATHRLP